jgi:hypothetical protein
VEHKLKSEEAIVLGVVANVLDLACRHEELGKHLVFELEALLS